MSDIIGRLGDVFYWAGCLAAIWAVGFISYASLTSGWSNDTFFILGLGGTAWAFGWAARYILSGYRGTHPIRPQVTEFNV